MHEDVWSHACTSFLIKSQPRSTLPCHTCPYVALIPQARSCLDPLPAPPPWLARHLALGAACVCWAPGPLSATGRPRDPNPSVGADVPPPWHFCGSTLYRDEAGKGRDVFNTRSLSITQPERLQPFPPQQAPHRCTAISQNKAVLKSLSPFPCRTPLLRRDTYCWNVRPIPSDFFQPIPLIIA